MRFSLSEVLTHIRGNKLRWAGFGIAMVLLSFWAVRHETYRGRLETIVRCEATECLKSYFEGAEKDGVTLRRLDSLEVVFVALDSSNNPALWRGVCKTRILGICKKPLSGSDPSFVVEKALFDAVAELSRNRAPLLLRDPVSGMPLRVFYGFPYWYDGMGLFVWAGMVLLLFMTAVFYASIKNRDLTQQARLWVNFAKETAHQLGTPLSSLYGWIEMLKMKLTENSAPADPKVLHMLDEAADDLRKLNQRVFRFSQIGSRPDTADTDLNSLVRETVDWFRERLPRADRTIQIVANYDEDIPLMKLNRDLMGWVVENLLKNAMDAIHKKEGIIQVETRFLPRENLVKITHTDNGSGIRRENTRKIFQPGFSTKKHGWGLGLALARRIVEEYHAGKIFVESTQFDRGTVITVELPVKRQKAADAAAVR